MAVDAIGHGELLIERAYLVLELLEAVEEGDHAVVELVVPLEVVLVALEAVHVELVADLVGAAAATARARRVLDHFDVAVAAERHQAIASKLEAHSPRQTVQQQVDLA